jgi:hypothetical protein
MRSYRGGDSEFEELQETACSAAGIDTLPDPASEETYQQYREWLPFAHRSRVVLERISEALGYH